MNQVTVVIGKRRTRHSSFRDAVSSVSFGLKCKIFDREFSDELIVTLKKLFLLDVV